MKLKKGVAVNAGVVIGSAFVLVKGRIGAQQRFLKTRTTEAAQKELDRFRKAVELAIGEAQEEAEKTRQEVATLKIAASLAEIFHFQVMMFEDINFLEFVRDKVETKYWSAEHAVQRFYSKQKKIFSQHKNESLRTRTQDLDAAEDKLMKHLVGETRSEFDGITEPVILVARDLTPSETSKLPKDKILGIATDFGGKTSHTAIIAVNRGIPAVVGLGNITADVQGGETLILDGGAGKVVIDPDNETLAKARDREKTFEGLRKVLDDERTLPAETLDGHAVRLYANIEFPSEIEEAIKEGALGIGLYRTEFLYDDTNTDPTEEQHIAAYKEAIERLQGRPLVIRTLDLGADKFSPDDLGYEKNPFLGCRSIRYCLYEKPDIFRRQLRAILRVSKLGNVKIMLPMISALEELREAKNVIQEVMGELRDENLPFNEDIEVGIMIEVPSAALCADLLAQECSFFSIGTNDLVQYALAVDRVNAKVAYLYQPTHPAIFRLLLRIIEAGRRKRIPVSICGEISGEPSFTLPLVGLGMRDLSMAPSSVPRIKHLVRSISAREASRIADTALTFQDAKRADDFLRQKAKEIFPELFG
ncbi:phosphoenolpyruvate--protein phosphotransferase [bacterium]|nr:phosphoenolpyruvate--protein phosphotransferase [bacterium]